MPVNIAGRGASGYIPRMQRGLLFGAVAGFVAGGVTVALLHSYPKDVVTRHRYCQVCAAHEQTYHEGVLLGARSESSQDTTGPLSNLLNRHVGEHEHRYTEWATVFPTFGVPPEHPEVSQKAIDLEHSQDNPYVMSGLVEAIAADKPRTLRIIHHILEPSGPNFDVLAPLERSGTIEERLAKVEEAVRTQPKK